MFWRPRARADARKPFFLTKRGKPSKLRQVYNFIDIMFANLMQ